MHFKCSTYIQLYATDFFFDTRNNSLFNKGSPLKSYRLWVASEESDRYDGSHCDHHLCCCIIVPKYILSLALTISKKIVNMDWTFLLKSLFSVVSFAKIFTLWKFVKTYVSRFESLPDRNARDKESEMFLEWIRRERFNQSTNFVF